MNRYELAATILTGAIAGCGTIASQSHARFHFEMIETESELETAITKEHQRISNELPCPDQIIYGGAINRCALGLEVLTSRDGQAGAALIFGGPFLLLDLCSSAVLDTMLLPVTLSQQATMHEASSPGEKSES